MLVEIYSDIACPWCYIGKRRFERALAEFDGAERVDVVFRPYQLDPSAAASSTPLPAAMERKFGPQAGQMMGRVTAIAAQEGIEMRMDRALSVNTFAAHRLLWLAERELGAAAQRDLASRLFDGYFVRGEDVGDAAALAAMGAEVGLDAARVLDFLAGDEGADEVAAAIAEAREMGITAVPTFVFEGKYAVPGAQEPAVFAQALGQVASELAG